MSVKVTITFEVPEELYKQYEDVEETLAQDLQQIGIEDVVTTEHNTEDYKGVTINKDVLCEIDSELFFDNVSMDTKSWSYDYDDLKGNTKVFEYIQKHYPNELRALKDGVADYITVYYD
jgi:hypothetical protein